MDLKCAGHRCHDKLQFLLRIPKSLNDVADKRAVLNLMRCWRAMLAANTTKTIMESSSLYKRQFYLKGALERRQCGYHLPSQPMYEH